MSGVGPFSHVTQNWSVAKPAVRGRYGMAVSQCGEASQVGAAILEAGGTAVDAAVAMALALATCEPWNSGLGGIGFGVFREASGKVWSLDFGPVSPHAILPEHYRLTGEKSLDIFGWPKVEADRNVHGPLSFCLPSGVAGLGRLHESFGRLPWRDVVAPAVALARRGMAVDWFSTVKISQVAHYLRLYESTARIYLPNGLPPVGAEKGNAKFLSQGGLADTLAQLQDEGWRGFYRGGLAEALVADIKDVGGLIDADDLASVDATLTPAATIEWEGCRVHLPPVESAALMLRDVLHALRPGARRDGEWFAALARALLSAVHNRIESNADEERDPKRESCTTHLNVTDATGQTIALTNSLLGLMGSAVVLPRTGVLMNNGMMWFDPRQGRTNSIAPGRRPQSNMLPVICELADGGILSLGGSGGRRILSAVASCLCDIVSFGLTPEQAAHAPRIDVSAIGEIVADRRMDEAVVAALSEVANVTFCEHAAAPLNFGCPSMLHYGSDGATGQPDVMTPWSTAIAARPPKTSGSAAS